jgi:hypothetical protein
MTTGTWVRVRRKEVGIPTVVELTRLLQLEGLDVARSTVSAWEVGPNSPQLEKPEVRTALMRVLKLSESELLSRAGFKSSDHHRSEAAEVGADIINELPPDKQDLAVRILEQLRAS